MDDQIEPVAGWRSRLDATSERIASLHPRLLAAGVGVLLLGVVVAFVVGLQLGRPDPIDLPRVAAETIGAQRGSLPSTTVPGIHVHVAGAVQQPGLYRTAAGSRVAALIDAAGGPTELGDIDRLNLAQVVQDGDRIEVPEVGQPVRGAVTGLPEADAVVDVNRADASDLQRLPGIGPALAAAIVDHRTRFGPFATLESLTAVSGIGPATVERLAALARV